MHSDPDCPDCGEPIRLSRQPAWRYSRWTLIGFAAAGVLTIAWVWVLLRYWPDYTHPRRISGFAGRLGASLAPGIVAGGWAARLPKLRTLNCRQCGWTATIRAGDREPLPESEPDEAEGREE